MNILFIERDPATRRFIKDMLERAGASLTEIGGAADLPAVADVPTALAIVEVEPGGQGLAAIVRVAGREPGRPAIIALASDREQAEASRVAGADEALVEPVALTTLFAAIERFLPNP